MLVKAQHHCLNIMVIFMLQEHFMIRHGMHTMVHQKLRTTLLMILLKLIMEMELFVEDL